MYNEDAWWYYWEWFFENFDFIMGMNIE